MFPGGLGLVEAPAVSNEGRRRPGLFFVVEPNRTQLSELGQRIAARPVLGAVMPAPREGMAFAAKQCGRSPGKIVRQVANDPA